MHKLLVDIQSDITSAESAHCATQKLLVSERVSPLSLNSLRHQTSSVILAATLPQIISTPTLPTLLAYQTALMANIPGDFKQDHQAPQRQGSSCSNEYEARTEPSSKQYARMARSSPTLDPTPTPGLAEGRVPLPQNAQRPYPQYQSQMQNAGMAIGAVAAFMPGTGGGSVGGDLVAGGVIGGIVGQRLA